MYAAYLILLGLSIISNSVLIIILYHRSQRSPAIIAFILFLLLANIWIAPKFLTNILDSHFGMFEILSRISALGYVFFPVAFLAFSFFYASFNKIFNKLSFWIFLLLPAIAFLYLSWTTNIIGVHDYTLATKYAWGYETPAGKYFYLFVVWFIGLMIISLIVLILYYRTLHDDFKKRQVISVIFSIITPLAVGSITNGILPLLGVFTFPSGIVLGNMMSVTIAYAIYRYRLFVVTPGSVLSSIQHAIIAIDTNGLIVQMNPSAEELLKVKEEKVIGRQIEEILLIENKSKKQNNQLMRLVNFVLWKGKGRTFYSYRIMNIKRHVFPYTISISPIYLEKKIIGANVFLRDTKREYERERLKDDYLNMMSHELKTPITSIKLYNQLLLKELPDDKDKKRQLIIKMDVQLDRIKRMIQDYYNLSVINTGKVNFQKEYFVIDDFISDIIETMKVTHKNRKIKIKGATGSLVYADKDKIEQVCINLINNAVKFSPAHKEIIVILESNIRNVTVGIRDFGSGIAPQHHKKIFDRFYQIKAKDGKKGGMGIGLYIASSIIKYHQGKIWVESKLGKGSTFYFSLPVRRRTGGNPGSTLNQNYYFSYE